MPRDSRNFFTKSGMLEADLQPSDLALLSCAMFAVYVHRSIDACYKRAFLSQSLWYWTSL